MPHPGFDLIDPRPIQRENPYTFFVPGNEELAEVAPGLLVKLIFTAVPASQKHGAERMWVLVKTRNGDHLTGTLDNEPDDIPGLKDGDPVAFQLHHIIAVQWEDPAQDARFASEFNNWFARCFVDDAVLEQRARVGFIYREPPEHDEKDEYPDTGWRIRADVYQLSDEEYENSPFSYVAIGAVLNRDDSFVDLLGCPVGSAFLRDPDSDTYQPTEPGGD